MASHEGELPIFRPDLPPEAVEASVAAIQRWCQDNGKSWGDFVHGLLEAYAADLSLNAIVGVGLSPELVLQLEPHIQQLAEIAADSPESWRNEFTEDEQRLIANEVVHINTIDRE